MILTKLSKTEKQGISYGMISPFLYAIDSVLDIVLFAVVFSINYRGNLTLWQTITYSFVTSFFKDFLLFIYISFRTKGQIFKMFFNLFKHKKRAFWWTILGSLCGGPLGLTLTTATILYSGAAYGAALANFSPIVVLLFAFYFFRTKLNIQSWIGVGLAVSSFIGLAFYSSFLSDENFGFNLRIFIGVILAVLAVLTWSVETIIAEYVEKFGKSQSLSTEEKLVIKAGVSASSNLSFFLPLSLLFSLAAGEDQLVFAMFNVLFTSWESWLILIVIGLVVTFGRIGYWQAIARIGGGRADILYYLTVLITPLLVLVLSGLNVKGFEAPLGVTSAVYWILLFLQMTGVFLITIFSKNNKRHLFIKSEKK